MDFGVDTPDILPQMIDQLMVKKSWSKHGVTLSWQGERSVKLDDGLTFSPPINVTLEKSIVKFTTSLTAVKVSNSGKTVKLVLTSAPDITINFK